MHKQNKKLPTGAVIAITYKCNSRCKMCNIWQKTPTDEMRPSEYFKLPKSLDDINITGGEPFLRDDVLEIIENVFTRCRPGKLVISSNGYLTDKIAAAAGAILKRGYKDKVTIALSLDGIGDAHNEIRGIPGAFDMVMNTINGLRQVGFKSIGIGYTFMAGNEKEHGKVYELAKKMQLNFGATIAHNAENYFSTQANSLIDAAEVEKQVSRTIDDKIKSFCKSELGKCYYLHGLAYYGRTRKSLLPCAAMSSSFFMDPKGEIFPCNILNRSAGNLRSKNFDEIWNSQEAVNIRSATGNCPAPCWMVCTGKPAIKKHWFNAGIWILRRKIANVFK